MTLVIDEVRKEKTFSKIMDINSTSREDFDDLRAFLYAKYIKEFETIRNLRVYEKPKLSHWIIRISSSKAINSIYINDNKSWLGLLTTLRQMERDSERDRKLSYKIYAEVIYRTFDR
jgi:hypothetical protein